MALVRLVGLVIGERGDGHEMSGAACEGGWSLGAGEWGWWLGLVGLVVAAGEWGSCMGLVGLVVAAGR